MKSESYAMREDVWYEDVEEIVTQPERNILGVKVATMIGDLERLAAEKTAAVRAFRDREESLKGAVREHSRGIVEGVMCRSRPVGRIYDHHRQLVYHVVMDANPPIVIQARDMDDLEVTRDSEGEVEIAIVEAATAWLGKHRATIKAAVAKNAEEAAPARRGPGRPPKSKPKAAKVAPDAVSAEFDVTSVKGVSKRIKDELLASGLRTPSDILDAGAEGLARIKGMGENRAAALVAYCQEFDPGHVAKEPAPQPTRSKTEPKSKLTPRRVEPIADLGSIFGDDDMVKEDENGNAPDDEGVEEDDDDLVIYSGAGSWDSQLDPDEDED